MFVKFFSSRFTQIKFCYFIFFAKNHDKHFNFIILLNNFFKLPPTEIKTFSILILRDKSEFL